MNLKKLDPLVPINIGLTEGFASAFFAVVATRLGALPLLIGLISSAPYLGDIFAPLWSFFTEKLLINKVLSISLFGASFVITFLAFVKNPLIFALLVVVYFVFFAAWDVLYPALIDLIYSDLAVSVISKFDELRSISYTLIVIASGFVMELLGGHKITFILGAIALLTSSFIAFFDETKHLKDADILEKTGAIAIIKEDKNIFNLVLIFMIAGTGMVMMLPAIPILEVNILKLTNAKIGILIGINSVSYILGTEIWNWYVKDLRRLYMTFNIGLASIVIMALIYALFPNYTTMIIANVFCGIGGASVSFFSRTFAISYPDYRTEDLASLHLFTCGIRGIYAPLLGALIVSAISVKANFLIAIIFIIISLSLFLLKGRDIYPT